MMSNDTMALVIGLIIASVFSGYVFHGMTHAYESKENKSHMMQCLDSGSKWEDCHKIIYGCSK